jgi:hypothetical protein
MDMRAATPNAKPGSRARIDGLDAGLIELAQRASAEAARVDCDDGEAGDRLFYLFRALRALQPRTMAGARAKVLALIALGVLERPAEPCTAEHYADAADIPGDAVNMPFPAVAAPMLALAASVGLFSLLAPQSVRLVHVAQECCTHSLTPAAAWRHLGRALDEYDAAVAMAQRAVPLADSGTRAEVALAEGVGAGLHAEAIRLLGARSHGQLEPAPERVMALVDRFWGVISHLANLAIGPAAAAI